MPPTFKEIPRLTFLLGKFAGMIVDDFLTIYDDNWVQMGRTLEGAGDETEGYFVVYCILKPFYEG
jgi:hypothetical protein